MPFQVPNDLIMLARTVAILSGMCTGLDPDFNLWDQISPYARKLIEKEATKGISDWLEELGSLLQNLIALPSQASRVFARAERGDLVVQSPQVVREVRALDAFRGSADGQGCFSRFITGWGVTLHRRERLVRTGDDGRSDSRTIVGHFLAAGIKKDNKASPSCLVVLQIHLFVKRLNLFVHFLDGVVEHASPGE
ncbi:MAG: hypothetical protein MZV63_06670 [Marinilabiliales bacterium]|nr:hypothetical protein [Marinilabiliales bacterium]